MQTKDIISIKQYLAALPMEQKEALERIYKIIKNEVPSATEEIAYQMPAFKLGGKPLIYFAAFKNHLSIFPTSGPVKELEKDLKKYTTSKGTIKFRAEQQLPEDLIKKILKVRVKQITS